MVLSAAVLCLALTVYHESKSEPVEGQRAVAQVVINRSKENGTTICQEVHKPGQFSWVKKKTKKLNPEQWTQSVKIAKEVLAGARVPLKATFFKRTDCKVVLGKGLRREKIIGQHSFFAVSK
jgi:N-acetylmuramoyl-L-alanine amidase